MEFKQKSNSVSNSVDENLSSCVHTMRLVDSSRPLAVSALRWDCRMSLFHEFRNRLSESLVDAYSSHYDDAYQLLRFRGKNRASYSDSFVPSLRRLLRCS
jgi:hypothetical protein